MAYTRGSLRRHAVMRRVRRRNVNMSMVWFWFCVNEASCIGVVGSALGILMFPYQLLLPVLLFFALGALCVYSGDKRIDLVSEMVENMRHTKDEKFIFRAIKKM